MKISIYDKPRENISFNSMLLPERLRQHGLRDLVWECPKCQREVWISWPRFLHFIGICECGEVVRIDADIVLVPAKVLVPEGCS